MPSIQGLWSQINITLANFTYNRDDEGDHIDSDTPRSGVATPQPDPSDKRTPGILHSFYGQQFETGDTLFKVTPSSVDEPEIDSGFEKDDTTLQPHELLGSSQISRQQHPYPTPPVSHPSSLHKLKLSDASFEDEGNNVQKATAPTYRDCISESIPSHARRASSMAPLSNIVTPSNVHATDFSKPSDIPSEHKPSTSPLSRLHSEFHKSPSYDRLKKLTSDGLKSIPSTPTRALSNQTSKSDQSALSANSDHTAQNGNGQNGKSNTSERPAASSRADSSMGGSVVPPKGKLTVKINEARGLRKSLDPYVVAVFQRNELVSKGPQSEEEDEDDGSHSPGGIPIGGIPISRTGSDSGRPMAIPMKSRQSSNTSLSEFRDFKKGRKMFTHPKWDAEAVFDVVGSDTRVNITIYDRAQQAEEFLGHVDLQANLVENPDAPVSGWFQLHGKDDSLTAGNVGEVHVEISFQRTEKRHYGPDDFQILKLIGKGTFGQVYQVRKKDTKRIYAMKVLQKKVIVQKKEVAHTVGERNILVRTATADSPFIVGLKFSFQTPTDLYLVTDYMSGGELFWHLQKEGRFDEQRAKFYIAELILALQHLHKHDIVYRDLKPENILLDANGHIALCDFGLSKANLTKNATTNTFCGTTEYLAPEVLLDEAGYTKMVDFWSLGVLVFEMCCGWSPFYAEDTQQMYKNIAFGKVRFPRDTLTTEGRNFVKGLLNRNPKHRLGATDDAEELKRHPFFSDIDWEALTKKLITPPFKPKLKSETDTSNFDPEFTNALNGASSLNARAAALAAGMATSTPLSPGMQANFKGFTFVDESSIEENMKDRVKYEYDDQMDQDEKAEQDWEDPFDIPDKSRSDRMSGIMGNHANEDERMFNGDDFH
ncbi:Serine/threonine-protein kinase [Ciborinia camelliae]|nr:Serine/threonine-protein kinase [Ciborinia camelliae]